MSSLRKDWENNKWNNTDVTDKHSPEKGTPCNCLLGNNYSPNTYVLVNKDSLQEESAPRKVLLSMVFSNLNAVGSTIFLGNICSFV